VEACLIVLPFFFPSGLPRPASAEHEPSVSATGWSASPAAPGSPTAPQIPAAKPSTPNLGQALPPAAPAHEARSHPSDRDQTAQVSVSTELDLPEMPPVSVSAVEATGATGWGTPVGSPHTTLSDASYSSAKSMSFSEEGMSGRAVHSSYEPEAAAGSSGVTEGVPPVGEFGTGWGKSFAPAALPSPPISIPQPIPDKQPGSQETTSAAFPLSLATGVPSEEITATGWGEEPAKETAGVGNTPGPSSSFQEDGFSAPPSRPSQFQLQRDLSPSEETGWGQPAVEKTFTPPLPARSPGKQLAPPPGIPSKLPASPTAPPGFPPTPRFRAGPPGFEGPPNPRTPGTDAPRPNRAAGKAKPTLDEIYAKVSVAPKVEGATGWDAPTELPEDDGPLSGPEQTPGWSAASTDELPPPTDGHPSFCAWHTNLDSRAPSYQPKTQPAVQTSGGSAEHSDFAGFPLLDDGPLLQNPAVRSSLNGNARAYQPHMSPKSPPHKFAQHDVLIPEPYNPIMEQGRPRFPRPVRPQLPDLPEGCISAARFFPSSVDTALSSTQRGGVGRMLMTALKNAVANAGNGSGLGGREDGERSRAGVGRKYAPPLREAKRPTEGGTQERWVHDKWEELEGRGTNRGGPGKPRGAYMPFSKAPARPSVPTERVFEPKVDDVDPLADKWGGFAGKEESTGQDGGGVKNWDTDSDDEEKRGGGQQLAGGDGTQVGGSGSRRPRFGGCERLDIEGEASP
jgi:hypothetical protein